ncbi:GIY-YIG nuclease family protein [Fretibacter rubidus]|uniref:GIY-YIG nuclease family protein n=1 Tax=Fretibacter rubidus TaxID=570162 RepID=UPI00352AABCA
MSVSKLLEISKPETYKLHTARYNQHIQPLDVFISDKEAWHNWNRWISGKHEFNRQFILALIDFYPQRDVWLFGGVYEVMGFQDGHSRQSRHCHAYNSVLTHHGSDYIGRLKIHAPIRVRGRVFKLENRLPDMKIQEIIPEQYSGRPFPGYAKVSLSWTELCSIVANDRQDWKTALSNMQGVYLITLSDGRQYVGSASGNQGIWSRWSCYASTKDGGNTLMKEANDKSLGQYIQDATFTLLDTSLDLKTEEIIKDRESYWKRVLGTRAQGLNAN